MPVKPRAASWPLCGKRSALTDAQLSGPGQLSTAELLGDLRRIHLFAHSSQMVAVINSGSPLRLL